MLKATAAAGLVGTAGTVQGSGTVETTQQSSTFESSSMEGCELVEVSENSLDIGGRRIVGESGYDTIQGAWDDAADGDVVYVHSTYDAQAAGEQFPIVIDQGVKEVSIVGGHPSGSEINARHSNENIMEITGIGARDFRNTAQVKNLKFVGGKVCLKVMGAPNSAFSHLKFLLTNDHAVEITRNADGNGCFGTRWYDCEAWSCGGSGFYVDPGAAAHGTTFIRCNSTWNGYNGNVPGVQLSGFSSVWYGGTIQRSSGYGIRLRSGSAMVLRDTYFEGNGMHLDHPVHVNARGTIGLVIDGCYFLGRMQSGSSAMPEGDSPHDNVFRAITLHSTHTTSVRSCTHWHHRDGFVAVQGRHGWDNDVNEHTHHSISSGHDEFWVWDRSNRTRSNGVIVEQDLRDLEGKFTGDQGIHDGSGSEPWGPAVWDGSRWRSMISGNRL